MLSFIVFENDAVDAQHFPPRHAFLVGPDETPVQGQAIIGDGLVRCEKSTPGACGLAVQVEVPRVGAGAGASAAPNTPGTLGLLTLHTTLLPARSSPYLLMIELARRQIMLLLNKLEDWQLTDLPPESPIMARFEQARDQFTSALVAQREPVQGAGGSEGQKGTPAPGANPLADKLASQALSLALEAGEDLAQTQAARSLRARQTGEAYKHAHAKVTKILKEAPPAGQALVVPGSGMVTLPNLPAMGCAISPQLCTEPLQRAAQATCDFVTMPMRWIDLEPVEGKYNFTPTDKWIEWAVRTAKLPVVGGPVVDLRPHCAPEWLFIWENDYETLRDLVAEHVQAVVTRYRRTVSRWTVASGLHVNTNFKISFEQILDLTRLATLIIRKLHPGAKIQLEVQQPWGEYLVANRRSIAPYVYAEAVLSTQLPIDAIGVRVQMGHAEPGLSTRDMLSLSAMLDRFAQLEKPIFVTALGAPSAPIAPTPYVPRVGAEATDPYEPGYWRQPWSDQQQAAWLWNVLNVIASKPYVQGICWHDLYDPAPGAPGEMPSGGMMTHAGQVKPALVKFAEFRKLLRTPVQ